MLVQQESDSRPPGRGAPRRSVASAFAEFFRTEAAGGVILLACAALALIWANSPLAASYFRLWETTVTAGAGPLVIQKPLLLWINDGLMALFFFVVGLEIKREVLTGELAAPRKATLAIVAAVGGMVAPAVLYLTVNVGTDASAGWGIPMATDIAFALGVLALLGSRAPLALKVFLTAIAIVDDLGAVLVIALFYTSKLSLTALGIAGAFFVALVAVNRLGIQRTLIYALLGLGLWVAMLKSGVHATVAGVLVALTIPARRRIDAPRFLAEARDLVGRFSEGVKEGRAEPTSAQRDAVHALEHACERIETPLARLEHGLHGWVAFFIMPVFALANAGVALGGDVLAMLTDPVAIGIGLGLVLGKQVGVFGFAWAAVKTGLAKLPEGVTWAQVHGVSLLTGIGFTMSIFIANLAFVGVPERLDSAKLGILVASLISGGLGWWRLRQTAPSPPADSSSPVEEPILSEIATS
ncbi:MAG: Na+/H+ antiporter NhaA [Rhodothermaceae bacterium]|nr:Na+/H+ antiporter NhaA [Rhodothermaceae bacterium]